MLGDGSQYHFLAFWEVFQFDQMLDFGSFIYYRNTFKHTRCSRLFSTNICVGNLWNSFETFEITCDPYFRNFGIWPFWNSEVWMERRLKLCCLLKDIDILYLLSFEIVKNSKPWNFEKLNFKTIVTSISKLWRLENLKLCNVGTLQLWNEETNKQFWDLGHFWTLLT